MNVLVFSEASWDDKNSFGNTVSNFFSGKVWEEDRFCNFYARKQMPDNTLLVDYYNLSAFDIVKGILRLRIRGKRFTTQDVENQNETLFPSHDKEQKNIDKLHQKKNEFIYYGHEQIWRSKLWINQYFKSFILDNAPDILFAFATSPYILWPLIHFLKKNSNCKVVLLVADDVYESYDHCAIYRQGYLKREFWKCIQSADKLYGISDEMSKLYETQFGKSITTLYKGCDLSVEPKQYLNQPLRFVYAGNLLWGRDDTLALVAEALEELNQEGMEATLEIYTGTTVTESLQRKLNRGNSSRIMGSRTYDKIKQIMHEADVVLHVESFDNKAIDTVRYSFSTKIIDCLQSGNQIVGIGPDGIASINYLKKVDGAIVIDELNAIKAVIVELTKNRDLLTINADNTRKYASEHHDINVVRNKLRKDFLSLE